MSRQGAAAVRTAHPWVASLLGVVSRRFGHEVPERRHDAFRRTVVEAYLASGEASLDAYVAKVEGSPIDSPCVAELVSRFTVKESYFFRDEMTMATLRQTILPRIVSRASVGRGISIWSAGSSNGEEPYTLAILLDTLAPAGLPIRIVGTDLDESALRTARAGVYSEWSVRTLPQDLRHRYFEPMGSKFVLRERHRRWVRFELHNLADALAPIPEPGEFDLVLCRNVGIYLSDSALEVLYDKLARALAPSGLLVTAPSDPRPGTASGLSPVVLRERGHQATVVYAPHESPWRTGTIARPEQDPGADDEEADRPTIPSAPLSIRVATPVPPPPRSTVQSPPEGAPPSARDRAPTAERFPTRQHVERAIAAAPLDAEPYFALALFQIERNEYEAAEAALKKALYLAPRLAEAHYRLGLLKARRGDLRAARKSYWNALDAMDGCCDDAPSWAASLGACLADLEQCR